MRTKLLLAATFCAASVATSMAQVYSVNAVGYVNVSIPKSANATTFALVSNPLNGTNNLLSTAIPAPPDPTSVYLFRNGAFESYGFSFGAWDPDATVNPGEGFFLALDSATMPSPTVLTFVGEVPQGTLVNPIPAGFSLRASIVPQAGRLSADLGLVAGEGDNVYTFNRTTQGYESYGFSFGEWSPSDPNVGVAESFWYENVNPAQNWTRTFSVN